MRRYHYGLSAALVLEFLFVEMINPLSATRRLNLLVNAFAQESPFTDYRGEAPGNVHHITSADLPQPYATKSTSNHPQVTNRPFDAWPQTLPGFKAELYAGKLVNPRLIRTAPNGDLFVAESDAGKILVFRGITSTGKFEQKETFATGLHRPFGIAFYPRGPNPQYVYVGNTDSIVRFPYANGDMKARGPQQVVIPSIPSGNEALGGGGHWTRDIAFSLDGTRMFIAVGSRTNVNDPDSDPSEFHRANVLVADPEGKDLKVYAWGIRNPVGLAIEPHSGELWASVNERDELGDNLPPDYITHVQEAGFYGWPWYYIGGNPDPRHAGKHPELREKVIVPDVLLEPHNASLEMTFYDGQQFPEKYRGGIFAGEHGSWNRSVRTGYEVIYVPTKNGRGTGEYMDFVSGFVTKDGKVWGRPVGVTVAKDGSLMVTDDGSGSIWRISYANK
jgi:glucose/arabinose dehydrogenase